MIIDNEDILLEFTSNQQVGKWNKKYNTNYKIGDKIFVKWYQLTSQGKYRWLKLKVKCDECGKEMLIPIKRIKFYDNNKNLCKSCCQKGERGYWHTHQKSKEELQHMSKLFSGNGNPFYGHTHNQETKEKIRSANIGNKNHFGHKQKLQTKIKISKTVKAQYSSGERTFSHGNQHKGYYKNILFESSFEEKFLKHVEQMNLFDKITRGPVIRYKSIDNKIRNYLSDFWFKDFNFVIEIKSDRYWKLELENNIKKMNAAKRKYKYIVIINNDFSEFDKIINNLIKK